MDLTAADKLKWAAKRVKGPAGGSISYLGWPDEGDLDGLLEAFAAYDPVPALAEMWVEGKNVDAIFAPNAEWPTIVPQNPPERRTVLEEELGKMLAPPRPKPSLSPHNPTEPQPNAPEKPRRWKHAEPQQSRLGGRGIFMGVPLLMQNQVYVARQNDYFRLYRPRVNPTTEKLKVHTNIKEAIATDWDQHLLLDRTNAVTFRGDTRSPHQIIVKAGGFTPNRQRTDRAYIEGKVAVNFRDYVQRRYGKKIKLAKIIEVIDRATDNTARNANTPLGNRPPMVPPSDPFPKDFPIPVLNPKVKKVEYGQADLSRFTKADVEKMLVDAYLVWKLGLENEASHLGRHLRSEFHKNWISTSRSLKSALDFADSNRFWVYVTIVEAGFVVPTLRSDEDVVWGTAEAEIAQFGNIPAERIVGFRSMTHTRVPDSPIFLRKSFIEEEPAACEAVFRALSGARSTAQDA